MKDATESARPNPRRKAWEFLRDCERSGAYINISLGKMLSSLDQRDRPFATELINGSVRMRRMLDFIIDLAIERSIDDETRSILRLSCYEAYFLATADHAIVNEYVSLAKTVIGQARSGFINAVMRKLLREREALQSSDMPLGIRTSHPDWIIDAFAQILKGDELERELSSHNEPAKVQVVSFDPLSESLASKSPNTEYGYILKVPPSQVEQIATGEAFVQDEGSQIVVDVALKSDPERKLKWLDMCAGPGGKFRYLKHFLDQDHLDGNELHPHRAKLVMDQAPGYQIFVGEGERLGERAKKYDRILLDAPCTGIGALRRRPDARWRRSEADLKSLLRLQRQLLDGAVGILEHHGIIVYVTCSPHLMETKVQVQDFLRRHENFSLRRIDPDLVTDHVRDAITPEGMVQLMTGRHGTDGMFLALLERKD